MRAYSSVIIVRLDPAPSDLNQEVMLTGTKQSVFLVVSLPDKVQFQSEKLEIVTNTSEYALEDVNAVACDHFFQ